MSETFVVGASGKPVITKDPNAVLDYIFDWTAWLVADVIQTATPAIIDFATTGGVIDSSAISGGNKVIVWVSGGIVGQTIGLRCRIATTGGRTDDRTVYLKVKER
jgi:hypothetical protein